MKTTLSIADGVMRHLKAEAARRGETMSVLVESALRAFLEKEDSMDNELPPLPRFNMGEPLVDLADRDQLYERMDPQPGQVQAADGRVRYREAEDDPAQTD